MIHNKSLLVPSSQSECIVVYFYKLLNCLDEQIYSAKKYLL